MSRLPWERNFPDAFVNAPWSAKKPGQLALREHALYNAAKGQRDIEAAIQIVDDLAEKRCIYGLADLSEGLSSPPTLIAPSCQPGDSTDDVEKPLSLSTGYFLDLGGTWRHAATILA